MTNPSTPQMTGQARLRVRKVLLVDDDQAISEAIKEALMRIDIKVVHATTIESAEDIFSEHSFDAVLLDANVNGGIPNTVRFLGKMRNNGYLGMVVGISGCDDSNTVLRQHGAQRCISKMSVVRNLWGLFKPDQA